MPALVAFGRRWKVGSDDFVLPGLIDVSVKFCWFVAAVVVYFRNDAQMGCPSGRHMKIYIYGIMTSLLLIILVDLLAMKTTMTSYIMDTKARRFLAPCIYIRLSCEFIDVCWNLLGTIWVYGGTLKCEEAPEAVAFIKRFILCNWFSVVVLCVFITCLFDSLGGRHDSDEMDPFKLSSKHYAVRHEEFWTKKWRRMCCYFGGGRDKEAIQDGFEQIGKIFSAFLRDHDFVSTDVIAGFVALYQKEQEMRDSIALKDAATYNKIVHSLENQNQHRAITKQPQLEDKLQIAAIVKDFSTSTEFETGAIYDESVTNKSTVNDIVLANHYLDFVLGSYGWPAFINNQYKNRAWRRLWKQLQCCSCFRSQEFSVVGDNCCLCNSSALKETAMISETDLVFVSFKNEIYRPVFYVAVDHKTKAIVLAIRGTVSLVDIVADLTLLPKSLDIPGLPPQFKANHGVALCAYNIQKLLHKKKILEQVGQKYPDYNLVITGASLGASTATILGLIYRKEFPKLKVYAISPLGGLLSAEAAKFSEQFAISIVYGDDMIPRLSLPSLETLKYKIINAIMSSRSPKYHILLGCCASLFCGRRTQIRFEPESADSDASASPSQSGNTSRRKHDLGFSSKYKRHEQRNGILTYPMFLPGRILHVTERKNYSDLQGGHRWRMGWAERTEFTEIIVSPRMYKDHFHFRLQKALHEYVVANRESITLNLM